MNKSRFLWLFCSLFVIALAVFVVSVGGTAVASNQSAQSASSPRFLTGPNEGTPLEIALAYINRNRESLGLTQADVSDFIVTDQYTSQHNGTTHIYLRQVYRDIELFGANININIAQNGAVINIGNQFVANLASGINTAEPGLTAVEAVQAAAQSLNLVVTEAIVEQEKFDDAARTTIFSDGGISLNAIPARLVYQPVEGNGVRLAWEVEIYELDAQNWWNIRIDALTGAELGRFNYVVHENFGAPDGVAHSAIAGAASSLSAPAQNNLLPDQYRVYAPPLESPNHGGRTLEADPADTTASPFGWHDTNGSPGAESTFTVGNNVDAYEDTNNSNSPTGGNAARADGGALLNFDFPINLGQQPSSYQDAAITNLFYWNNFIHDVFYHYGFNEASGNFQENNYGNGGAGSDSVNAEAQDGGGINNANFATPSDGGNPRMQMYLWNLTSPMRDGDLDNGVIVHEYGHGISNRLTGGPNNVFCLGNAEQAGEGWSDWFALMLTIEAGDAGTDRRGIGTYVLGQPTTGTGIRAFPYSTDMTIDPRTYDTIKTAAIPHGVGSVWAAITWEVTWALIDTYGFDPNIYNGTGGNNMALQLIVDGLKLQPCSPGFVDARNAILLADQNNNGGANQCLLWEAFAKRGLGFSANQGSSSSRTDGTQAFDLPPECQGTPPTPTNTPVPPTPTNTPVPPTATPTPGPSGSMHVADLDGSSANNGNTWTAVVTILVVDNNGVPVQNATVNGNWSNGASGSAVCVTNSSGACDVAVSGIPKRTKDVTFSVSNITHATLSYNPAANTDPDGDSNGTTIVVSRN
jgi:extracellular elastinolytic metalloproteinase